MLFIAAGSSPIRSAGIEGLDQANIVLPDDIYQGLVLQGEQIVIIGGGSVGCETALHLAKANKKVTVVEMLPELAPDLFLANRKMLLEEMKKCKVEIMVNTMVRKASQQQIHAITDGKEIVLPAGVVILAIGRKANDQLNEKARELVDEVYVIGDSLSPRKIKDAIWEAYKIGRVI